MNVSLLTLAISFCVLFIKVASSQETDPVKELIFKKVQQSLQKARDGNMQLLSPNNFAKADQYYQKALKDYENEKNLKIIKENLYQVVKYINSAYETSKISRIVLESAIQMREELKGLDNYAESNFFKDKPQQKRNFQKEFTHNSLKADRKFSEAARKIEDGNLKSARFMAKDAEKHYRKTAIEVLKKGVFSEAKKKLKDLKKSMLNDTYRKAEAELEKMENFLDKQKKFDFIIKDLLNKVNDRIQLAFSTTGLKINIAKSPDQEKMYHLERSIASDTNKIRDEKALGRIKTSPENQENCGNLSIKTPGGKTVIIKEGISAVSFQDCNGNSVKLDAQGISINVPSKVILNASAVEITSGIVTVNAGLSKFSGALQCDTIITNSVVSASYTPGAGNIW